MGQSNVSVKQPPVERPNELNILLTGVPESGRVCWKPKRKADWAGDGRATVIAFEQNRPFFGADSRADKPTPGPAFNIRLDHKGLEQWVPPEELFSLEVSLKVQL